MATRTDRRGNREETRGERIPPDFETAQHELLDAVGLEVRSRFVELDRPRIRTHVFEAGPAESDVPIVFVHGTAEFGAFLAPLMTHLQDTRLIGFDRPGYGLSDPFVYTEANVRQTVLESLVGVLDELDLERIDLVGHSMGGHAAILFALSHPERVRRLTLVGSVPAVPGTQPPIPIRLLTAPVLGRVIRRFQTPDEEGVLDVAEIFGEREAITDYPAFIRAIAAHEREPKSAEAGVSEFGALISVLGWRRSIRLHTDDLRRITQPTTVVWGDHDTLGTPDDVRETVEAIPDVRFEVVDAGHIPFLSQSARCAELVRER